MADDFPASPATTGTLAVGASVTGIVDPLGDRDWIAVTLEAGEAYRLDLEGAATGQGTLYDPYILTLRDAAGAVIPGLYDDDGGAGLNASLLFEAPAAGTFFVEVGAWSDQGTGTWRLSLREEPPQRGTPGDDWLAWDPAHASVDGLAGTDMLSFAGLATGIDAWRTGATPGGWMVEAGATTVRTESIEGITGTSRADEFRGGDGDDVLRGLGGADLFRGLDGADRLYGGAGTDSAYFGFWYEGGDVAVSLLRGRGWTGDAAGDRLDGIENLFTGGGNDRLWGDNGANHLFASYGDDTLYGNGGNDVLDGYHGTDVAVFAFDRALYDIVEDGFRTYVTYLGPGTGDGADILAHVEVLRFADGDLIL